MSELILQPPVQHIPGFREFFIDAQSLAAKFEELGIQRFPKDIVFDSWYYYTDLEGWGKVLGDLVFNSSLYKADKFDCEDYAMKAQVVCAERYGLNALRLCIGDMPLGLHGFNIFFHGDGFLLWEPNEGYDFSGSAFEIGEYGYQPRYVLL